MSVNGWSLVRFLHVTAAMGWVGGQLLLSGVVMPVLRKTMEPAQRGPIIHAAARRFGDVANFVLLPTLLATGLAMLYHRGVTLDTFGEPGYGRLLTIKLSLVVVAIVLSAVHGVIAARSPKSARPLAITGLGTSLAIVVFATALVP